VNKNLTSNSCGGINEKKTKVISVGQIHLFCWGGRWQTGSKMAARGGGGGVDSDLFGRGGGVCFSHMLFIILFF